VDPKNGAMDPKNRDISCGWYSTHSHLLLGSGCSRKSDFPLLIRRKSREGAVACSQQSCSPESCPSLEELCVALSLMFHSSFPKLT